MELKKKIYDFILDYWQLIKKYTPRPEQDDTKVWDDLLEDAEEVLKKHKDDSREYQFFKVLILAWFDYLGKGDYGNDGK